MGWARYGCTEFATQFLVIYEPPCVPRHVYKMSIFQGKVYYIVKKLEIEKTKLTLLFQNQKMSSIFFKFKLFSHLCLKNDGKKWPNISFEIVQDFLVLVLSSAKESVQKG